LVIGPSSGIKSSNERGDGPDKSDPIREILPISWDDPEHGEICEEIGQGIILIKTYWEK
jgi:hypothetical protein